MNYKNLYPERIEKRLEALEQQLSAGGNQFSVGSHSKQLNKFTNTPIY